ncbi:MAG: hypothetical protein ABR589_05675 [Chthoniobacterales bacterium]
MQNSPSESGFSTLRVLLAFILCTVGAGLAVLSFAADPASGIITPTTTTTITWQGTGTGVPPTATADCEEGANCDSFKLTITGTPADWIAAGKQVKVRIEWLSPSSDYDLTVHKGSVDGPVVASSGAGATTFEQVILNPRSSSVGTGDFFIRSAYFAATPADQYHGVASVVDSGPAPKPAPTPVSGIAPRYQNYTPPAAGPATLGLNAGEPSIGINWTSEGVLPEAGDDKNGGRAMYIALTQTLRITFDDTCPSSPSALWEDKSFPTTSAITFDPILYTDNTRSNPTGRTLVSQLLFPAGFATTASAFTDNDGETWIESTGAGIGAGIDHQTIGGGGPFHAPVPIGVTYPNAIYYCAQLPASSCALSLDGGMTYGPAVPAYTNECGGLHGHIKVGPDGTAYLPNKNCSQPTPGQAVVVSEDNGATWESRPVPGSLASGSDAAVGIGRGDKTGGKGRIYLGYADADTLPVIATSTDRGETWSAPLDVGVAFGINNVAFPAVVAGDDDRAAFAFLGTPTEGGLQGPRFQGVWHLYVAHTYDGGKTWRTVDVTPDDPMQRGCIWLGGGANICRNLLDFMGIDVDKRGRVLVGYNDGCAGAECSQARPDAIGNSYTDIAAVARQTGGKGLFAARDAMFPDDPTVPGAPYVTALRNGKVVHLAWSTSNNGGSPVTQYTIARGTSSGGETFLTNVPGNQLRYDDLTATNPNVTYFYTVTASNAQGSSCSDNEVIARYVGDSHSAAGYTLYEDPTGDQTGAPAEPDLDIEKLSISEPSTGPGGGKLVFKLKVADLSTVPNNRMWRIIWDSPNAVDFTQDPPENVGKFYLGMTKDAEGEVTFEYGTVDTAVVGLVLGVPTTKPVGPPDSASFTPDGLITIIISKSKIGNPRVGDLLGNFAVRTYNVDNERIRTTNAIDSAANATANDFSANAATYAVVGPATSQLLNISARVRINPAKAEHVGIAGLIVRGSEPKRLIFRGRGPSLKAGAAPLEGRLMDPIIELHDNKGMVIAKNDNWKNSPKRAAIKASGLAPTNNREAVIIQTVEPDKDYTAVLRSADGQSGIGLVEIYDADAESLSELRNLSGRGFVSTGDNVLIGGVILRPGGVDRILFRAVGPDLKNRGIKNELKDPTLQVVDANGMQVGFNDDWRDSPDRKEIKDAGLAPGDPRESAVILRAPKLPNYTAIVRGKEDTGTALVEAFKLDAF